MIQAKVWVFYSYIVNEVNSNKIEDNFKEKNQIACGEKYVSDKRTYICRILLIADKIDSYYYHGGSWLLRVFATFISIYCFIVYLRTVRQNRSN